MSMAESILWTSLPRAMMSPRRDLSMRRCKGSVKTLEEGNAVPLALASVRKDQLLYNSVPYTVPYAKYRSGSKK